MGTSKDEEVECLRRAITNLESWLRLELEKMETAGAESKTRVQELERVILES